MNKITLVVSSAMMVLAGLSTLPIANAQSVYDSMLATVGEFEVGNGETRSIAHHKKEKEYRICVENSRQSVPLKVMYDGKEDTVAVGSCVDYEAMDIKVAPGAKLPSDMVIMGKFHRLNGR
jgi:hypothetical protein